MESPEPNFRVRVEAIVAQIPRGKVMTYGQIAALAGSPVAAQIVGSIAHYGNPELPWQRVVNKKGGLASGYHGGRKAQKEHLEADGIIVSDDYYVNVGDLVWWPPEDEPRSAQWADSVGSREPSAGDADRQQGLL